MSGVVQLLWQQVKLSQSFPYPILLLLICLPILITWYFFTTKNSKKNLPPSPPKLPILGNLHQLGPFPHRSLLTLSKQHGPLMLLHLGSVPALVVSSSDAAREITKTHDLSFTNRRELWINRKLFYNLKDVAVAPYGDYWRKMKSIFTLHLLSNNRVQSFRTVREAEIAKMVGAIEKACKSSNSSISLNFSELSFSLTFELVQMAALGTKNVGEEMKAKFQNILTDFMVLVSGFDVGEYIPWLSWVSRFTGRVAEADRVAKGLDEILDAVVQEHMDRLGKDIINDENEGKGDFVDIMLKIQKDEASGISIDRDSIKAMILDVFVGGIDTTTTVLEWEMTELLRHPKVMKKLQAEIRKVAKNKPRVTEDDLEKMPYLKAVVKETLRLYPPIPIPFPRVASEDVKVIGYDISAGTIVILNLWAIGRNPNSWDKPEEFYPERFLNSTLDYMGNDYEFIPFGSGRRRCPGINFAIANNEIVLANLLHKFDWKLPEGVRGEDLDMNEIVGLAIHRKVHLLAVPTLAIST